MSQDRETRPPLRQMATVAAFATFPYASLVATNVGEDLSLRRLGGYWIATLVVGLTPVIAASRRSWQNASRAAVVMSGALVLFFEYDAMTRGLSRLRPSAPPLVLWGVAAVLLLAILLRLSRTPGVQQYVALVGPALLLIPTIQLVFGGAPAVIFTGPDPHATEIALDSDVTTAGRGVGESIPLRPNIYYFVLDAYGSPEVVESVTGRDQSGFTDALEDMGFQVSDQAMANYPRTSISIASTLAQRYLADAKTKLAQGDSFRRRLRGDNETVAQLRSLGYSYIHAYPGGWGETGCSGREDLCIGHEAVFDVTDWAVLTTTPLSTLLPAASPTRSVAHFSDPELITRRVLNEAPASPYFLFAHLLNPHPPFLREADCQLREDAIWDPHTWLLPDDYGDAVECLNQQLLASAAQILDTDPMAIIVFQGDHGPAFDLDWQADDWLDAGRGRERMSALSAIRFPEPCDVEVPEDLSLVNTFRLIGSCLSGAPAEMLPNRYYLIDYGIPPRRERLNP